MNVWITHLGQPLRLFVLLTSALVLATGCGSDPSQEPTEDPEGNPWDLEPWRLEDPANNLNNATTPPVPDMGPNMPDMDPGPVDMAPLPPDLPPPVDMAPVLDPAGAACSSGNTCQSGTCYDGDQFPGGYCSSGCEEYGADCTDQEGLCVLALGGQGLCAAPCESQRDCRDGYECRPQLAGPETVCLPETPQPQGSADGEPCTQDSDCGGGSCIPEADGWPGGYCTTFNCQDRTDCSTPNGEDNRCYQNPQGPNACVRICQSGADCREDYVCQPVGGGVGFCVPDPSEPIEEDFSVYPFNITCGPAMGNTHTFNYTIDPTTTSYMATLIARDGREVYPDNAALPNGTTINYRGQNSFQLAVAQLFGWISPLMTPAIPQFANQLQAGAHTLTTQTNSGDVCTYLLQESTPGTTIDLNIHFVGVPGVNAANAPNNTSIQKVLDRFELIYAPAGITIGTVRYKDITGAPAQNYRIIRSEDDMSELTKLTELPGMGTYDDALSLNIFFVQSFAIQGGAIGTSLGLPGPAGIHGTGASGVVFTSEFLGQTFTDQSGQIIDGDNYTGVVLAHEVGHYIGLFHTTESFGGGEDPLQDTPECPRRDFPEDCPDLNNLMFPLAGIDHTEVTADQSFVIKANPLTKD